MGKRLSKERKSKQGASAQRKYEQIIAKSCKSFKSLEEYRLFIDGYIQQNYHIIVPHEITELIMNLYGKYIENKFEWFINHNDLKKILSNPTNTYIILQNNEIEIYGIKVIKPFQLQTIVNSNRIYLSMMNPEIRFESLYDYSPGTPMTGMIKGPPIYQKGDLQYECVAILFMEELNYQIFYAEHVDGWHRPLYVQLNELNTLHSLHFGCILEMRYMAIIDGEQKYTTFPIENRVVIENINITPKLAKFYFKKMKMSKHSQTKWILNDKLIPSVRSIESDGSHGTEAVEVYHSAPFNDNSFVIRFINVLNLKDKNKDYFEFSVLNLRKPFCVNRLYFNQQIITYINGKKIIFGSKEESVITARFERHLHFANREDLCFSKISVEVNVYIYELRDIDYNTIDETFWKHLGIDDEHKSCKYDSCDMFDTSHTFQIDKYGRWNKDDYIKLSATQNETK